MVAPALLPQETTLGGCRVTRPRPGEWGLGFPRPGSRGGGMGASRKRPTWYSFWNKGVAQALGTVLSCGQAGGGGWSQSWHPRKARDPPCLGQVGGKWQTPWAVACLTHLFLGPQWCPDPPWVCEALGG